MARAFAIVALVAVTSASAGRGVAQTQPRALRITGGLESAYYVAGMPRAPHTLADRMRHYRVPAVSIAVVDGYRLVWSYAAGLRDVAAKAPATTTTLFQAASMSKPVAAAGILALFEQRGLSLDADVNTLLRSWQVTYPPEVLERVTMRRLLSHSAGTNVHGFEGYDRDAPLPTAGASTRWRAAVEQRGGARGRGRPAARPNTPAAARRSRSRWRSTSAASRFQRSCSKRCSRRLGMTNSTFDQPLPAIAVAARGRTDTTATASRCTGDGTFTRRWRRPGCGRRRRISRRSVIAIQNALRGRGKPPIDATVAREMTTQGVEGFGLGPGVQAGYFATTAQTKGFKEYSSASIEAAGASS